MGTTRPAISSPSADSGASRTPRPTTTTAAKDTKEASASSDAAILAQRGMRNQKPGRAKRADAAKRSAKPDGRLRMAAGSLKMRNQRTCSLRSASKSRRQDSQRDRCRSNLCLTARGKSLSRASSARSMASLQFMVLSVLRKMRFPLERLAQVLREVSAWRNADET